MSRRNHTVPGHRHCDACGKSVSDRHYLRSGQPRCAARRYWDTPKLWKLMELTERGWSNARIAAHLTQQWGRTLTAAAVEQARERHGIPGVLATSLSAREVALMLGLTYSNQVNTWLAKGWLRGRRGPRVGPYPRWMVQREAVWDFVENSDHWHRWRPEVVADPSLRLHVERVRGDARYVTATEAVLILRGRSVWVERSTVEQWAHTGHLPSVRSTVRESGRGGNRLIPVAALETVEPPRIGGRRRAA